MKYRISILFLLCYFLIGCENTNISPGQADSFIKFFGNSFQDIGFDVKQCDDGGYVLIGTTTKVEINEGKGTAKDTEIFLVKTDKYGNEEWSKQFGGPYDDQGYSLQITGDGGYILLGARTDTLPNGEQHTDMYLVKTSGSGEEEWHQSIGGPFNEEGFNIQLTTAGGFILVGYTESFGNGGKDAYLVETNENGDTLWTRTHGDSGSDEIGKFVQEISTGFILIGSTDTDDPGQANKNVFVVKTNSIGKETARKNYGGTGDDFGECIRLLPEGGYVFVGTSSSFGDGSSKIYLVKIGENLEEVTIQNNTIGGSGNYLGKCISVSENNEFTIIGSSGTTGNYDIYLVKTDSNGNEIFHQTYGGTGSQQGEHLEPTDDGGFIIVGSNEFDGNSMVSLIKTLPDGELNTD